MSLPEYKVSVSHKDLLFVLALFRTLEVTLSNERVFFMTNRSQRTLMVRKGISYRIVSNDTRITS